MLLEKTVHKRLVFVLLFTSLTKHEISKSVQILIFKSFSLSTNALKVCAFCALAALQRSAASARNAPLLLLMI